MLQSNDYRELRKRKRYQASIERKMCNHGSTEEISNKSSSAKVERETRDFQTLTQEAVNEQNRWLIVPPTRQLEELTRLVQGTSISRHPKSYLKTELGTTSGTAMLHSDTVLI